MSGPIHIHPRRPQWLVGLAAASAAALACVIWSSLGDTPVAAPPPAPAGAAPATAARGEAPFPDLPLALVDITPRGAVIAVASRPASYSRGQEVFPGIVLDHIGADSVTLRFGTQQRLLTRNAAPAVAAAAPPVNTDESPVPPPDTRHLTSTRPLAAQAFLGEVQVHADPRGGYVVDTVAADGRYDRMGLRPGDVIYTLDTPSARTVDEGSMVALMQQTELELEVYRNGMPMRLKVALNED